MRCKPSGVRPGVAPPCILSHSCGESRTPCSRREPTSPSVSRRLLSFPERRCASTLRATALRKPRVEPRPLPDEACGGPARCRTAASRLFPSSGSWRKAMHIAIDGRQHRVLQVMPVRIKLIRSFAEWPIRYQHVINHAVRNQTRPTFLSCTTPAGVECSNVIPPRYLATMRSAGSNERVARPRC